MSVAKPQIAIYKGRGVSAHSYRCLRQLLGQVFDTVDIASSEINACALSDDLIGIVFPGGADVPYDRSLNDNGINHLRAFVENGGLYVGVCAGSYFASKAINFTCNDGSKICESRRLGFFNGTVQGPAYGTYIEASHASACVVELKIESKVHRAYFNGGGHFIADAPFKEGEILASYAHGGLPAALQLKVGKGHVLLWAIHPEYDNRFLAKVIHSEEKGYEALQIILNGGGVSEGLQTMFVDHIKTGYRLMPV